MMIRLLLLAVLLFLFFTVLRYLIQTGIRPGKKLNEEPGLEELVQDPYCQTYIPMRTAVRKRLEGRSYYFCSKECLRKFIDGKKSQKP